MLKLTELELLRQVRNWFQSHNPYNEKDYRERFSNELNKIIEKYDLAIQKISSKTKPLTEDEIYELKVWKGYSVKQIIQELYKRKKVRYSRSTIEKAIRVHNLVGKGRQAEIYKAKIENKLKEQGK